MDDTMPRKFADYIADLKDTIAEQRREIEQLQAVIGVHTPQPAGSFNLDADVPMPDQIDRRGQRKYPFREMAVNSSFFLAGEEAANRLNSAAQHYSDSGMKFTVRTLSEGGVLGARIWRVQ